MRQLLSICLALTALLGLPATAQSQSLLDLLTAMRTGGGWITIPIVEGRGTLEVGPIATGGLDVSGCFQVWFGHSGEWDVRAQDRRGDGLLEVRARPGEPHRFEYETGPTSHLTVDVTWSQPADTSLMLWVGLDSRLLGAARDPCEPVYGS